MNSMPAEQLVRHVRETGRLIAELPRGKGGRGKTAKSDLGSFIDVNPGLTEKFAAIAQRERERRAVIRYVITQTVKETE